VNGQVTLTIDGQRVTVPAGTTIAKAAEHVGIRIPTLCYHPRLHIPGSCRVCIVDVRDRGHHMAACSVPVWEGMDVVTNTPQLRQDRRDIVELLLDNHAMDCQTCDRSGNCELQNLAHSLGVRERLFEGARKSLPVDDTSVAVVRNPNKCILCGRCVRMCDDVQRVHNLSQHGRSYTTVVTPAHGAPMDDSVCIQCGQCIAVCPVAALVEKSHTDGVWQALADPDVHVIVQTAPAIRAAIGEGFGVPPGKVSTGHMVAALRRLGFDTVFDTVYGADLTIVEESHELLERLAAGGPLPLLTSCSPGWVNYLEKFYPELIPNASTCRSPMTITSVLAKTWFAQKRGLDRRQVYSVAVMPCVAKKFEAQRPEHRTPWGAPYTDAVLTTRELVWMLKAAGVDLWTLEDINPLAWPATEFDSPLGDTTGAGVIFGATGGVLEATLRTAAALLGDAEESQRLEFREVRAVDGIREADVTLGGRTLHVGVANGMGNAQRLLDLVVTGEREFHVLELMACPGGCVGGAGQPYPGSAALRQHPEDLLARRAEALYAIDGDAPLRRSHENPGVQQLYAELLGKPGSPRAHELLHTSYTPRLPRGIR
jgi:iron-only hydrogenase group A